VGAQLALALDLTVVAPAPTQGGPVAPTADGMAVVMRVMAPAPSDIAPAVHRQSIGRLAMEVATATEEQSIARLAILADQDWPANFGATAVNVHTGEVMVWRRNSGAPLVRAVASSCALPGVWPPVTIDGERFMDGGVRSVLNADLAQGHGAIIVVSCFELSLPDGFKHEALEARNAKLNGEIAALRDAGAQVDLVVPSAAFSELTQRGTRMLDASLVPTAFEMGLEQGLQAVRQIDPSWLQP
jgi:NTE family protein